jgi:hypothetical protein
MWYFMGRSLEFLTQLDQVTHGLASRFWVLLVIDAILVGLIIVTRMLTWEIMLLVWPIERHDDRRMKG